MTEGLLTTHEAVWYIISLVSVSIVTITFGSPDIGSSYLHIQYIHGIWVRFTYEGHLLKVKVTGAKGLKSVFSQCKTLIGKNSTSINPYSRNVKL